MKIHLIERLALVHQLHNAAGEWESGHWVVSAESADKLIGGDLYLHTAQDEPSHFGGRITGWRPMPEDSEHAGRIAFQIIPSLAHKGVRTGRDGWGNEKKFD